MIPTGDHHHRLHHSYESIFISTHSNTYFPQEHEMNLSHIRFFIPGGFIILLVRNLSGAMFHRCGFIAWGLVVHTTWRRITARHVVLLIHSCPRFFFLSPNWCFFGVHMGMFKTATGGEMLIHQLLHGGCLYPIFLVWKMFNKKGLIRLREEFFSRHKKI